jgi:hypothetical protein
MTENASELEPMGEKRMNTLLRKPIQAIQALLRCPEPDHSSRPVNFFRLAGYYEDISSNWEAKVSSMP